MAVYTELTKPFLKELADDYGLGRVGSFAGIPEGSVNSNYLLETAKGRFLLRVDEVKDRLFDSTMIRGKAREPFEGCNSSSLDHVRK